MNLTVKSAKKKLLYVVEALAAPSRNTISSRLSGSSKTEWEDEEEKRRDDRGEKKARSLVNGALRREKPFGEKLAASRAREEKAAESVIILNRLLDEFLSHVGYLCSESSFFAFFCYCFDIGPAYCEL